MGDGARFWRNVTLIAGAHAVLLIAFVRWGNSTTTAPQQQVVWMSGGNIATATATAAKRGSEAAPTPERSEMPEEQPTIAPAKSEIQLPVATATPTPAPTPRPLIRTSPTAPPTAAPSAKPTPRSTPKKSLITKATPKPRLKPTPDEEGDGEIDTARDAIAKMVGATAGGGGGNARSGGAAKTETQWYGRMLHDRFHNAWEQPTSVVAAGTKMSALVKARIEKDGRVSRFEVVKPSGNVVVDESVRAIAGRVTAVDALPNGVGNGDHYDVTINFELNPEE
jgi:TonB family protein